jgi:hypothetical protein
LVEKRLHAGWCWFKIWKGRGFDREGVWWKKR